ncbi:glyoxalase superfamily protein [Desertihabitans aurantiacus]|uniref:glyoxalase superfamily protein n=1 Tax=Desertihabitans aurantiacus TaxID=2282477 RepID=UPI0018E56EAE|nr:glyoxalase superfamily protein [Desertihabitans aurantiacus]
MIPFTADEAKALARALRAALPPGHDLTHGQSLDLLSRALGHQDWNHLAARYQQPGSGPAMPVLRVYDVALARAFYLETLGFSLDFEHRFEPGMPAFLGISRDETRLALSEHHGDGTPGTVVWIPVRALDAYRSRVLAAAAGRLRPGIDRSAPGGPTMTVTDPFGNELRFCEPS